MNRIGIKNTLRKFSSDQSVGKLSFQVIGDKNAPRSAVFLHGIIGNKRNWRTPSTQFVVKNPSYNCYTIDHRGHGDSHFHNSNNTLESCAEDLERLFDDIGIVPDLLCGHSFGGKVALAFLQRRILSKKKTPSTVWILDSLPGKYDTELDRTNDQSVMQVLEVLDTLPQIFTSREIIIDSLIQRGISKPIAQWLATNIIPATTTPPPSSSSTATSTLYYKWAFELPVIKDLFRDFCDTDMWPFLEQYHTLINNHQQQQQHVPLTSSPTQPSQIHFVRAGKNNLWSRDVLHRFEDVCDKNPQHVIVHHMPHVGHWIHVDDLNGLIALMSKYANAT